ncbi:conserved Plasmodium protein, unknown function [Plasmodium gaboni]|uniref:Endonuclease/exonuclease/phosphatase domain-containing protein n=1 Tax=Plasmodium gaboni TaxID=647221 RepID=A0ABY1ULN1_9APIC|nr:conserved Plasmodium protein, unknown function [Plasmodium gaboni]
MEIQNLYKKYEHFNNINNIDSMSSCKMNKGFNNSIDVDSIKDKCNNKYDHLDEMSNKNKKEKTELEDRNYIDFLNKKICGDEKTEITYYDNIHIECRTNNINPRDNKKEDEIKSKEENMIIMKNLLKKLSFMSFNTGLLEYKICGICFYKNPPFISKRLAYIPYALKKTDADIIALQEVYDEKHAEFLRIHLKSLYPYYARDYYCSQDFIKIFCKQKKCQVYTDNTCYEKKCNHTHICDQNDNDTFFDNDIYNSTDANKNMLSKNCNNHKIKYKSKNSKKFYRIKRKKNFLALHHGLLVFSKYPIIYSNFHSFKRVTYLENLFGTKGFLEVVIDVPSFSYVTLINMHLASAAVRMESKYIEKVRDYEIKQIMKIASQAQKRNTIPIIIGDLNAAPNLCPNNYASFIKNGWKDAWLYARNRKEKHAKIKNKVPKNGTKHINIIYPNNTFNVTGDNILCLQKIKKINNNTEKNNYSFSNNKYEDSFHDHTICNNQLHEAELYYSNRNSINRNNMEEIKKKGKHNIFSSNKKNKCNKILYYKKCSSLYQNNDFSYEKKKIINNNKTLFMDPNLLRYNYCSICQPYNYNNNEYYKKFLNKQNKLYILDNHDLFYQPSNYVETTSNFRIYHEQISKESRKKNFFFNISAKDKFIFTPHNLQNKKDKHYSSKNRKKYIFIQNKKDVYLKQHGQYLNMLNINYKKIIRKKIIKKCGKNKKNYRLKYLCYKKIINNNSKSINYVLSHCSYKINKKFLSDNYKKHENTMHKKKTEKKEIYKIFKIIHYLYDKIKRIKHFSNMFHPIDHIKKLINNNYITKNKNTKGFHIFRKIFSKQFMCDDSTKNKSSSSDNTYHNYYDYIRKNNKKMKKRTICNHINKYNKTMNYLNNNNNKKINYSKIYRKKLSLYKKYNCFYREKTKFINNNNETIQNDLYRNYYTHTLTNKHGNNFYNLYTNNISTNLYYHEKVRHKNILLYDQGNSTQFEEYIKNYDHIANNIYQHDTNEEYKKDPQKNKDYSEKKTKNEYYDFSYKNTKKSPSNNLHEINSHHKVYSNIEQNITTYTNECKILDTNIINDKNDTYQNENVKCFWSLIFKALIKCKTDNKVKEHEKKKRIKKYLLAFPNNTHSNNIINDQTIIRDSNYNKCKKKKSTVIKKIIKFSKTKNINKRNHTNCIKKINKKNKNVYLRNMKINKSLKIDNRKRLNVFRFIHKEKNICYDNNKNKQYTLLNYQDNQKNPSVNINKKKKLHILKRSHYILQKKKVHIRKCIIHYINIFKCNKSKKKNYNKYYNNQKKEKSKRTFLCEQKGNTYIIPYNNESKNKDTREEKNFIFVNNEKQQKIYPLKWKGKINYNQKKTSYKKKKVLNDEFTWDPLNPLNAIGPHSKCNGLRCDYIFFPSVNYQKKNENPNTNHKTHNKENAKNETYILSKRYLNNKKKYTNISYKNNHNNEKSIDKPSFQFHTYNGLTILKYYYIRSAKILFKQPLVMVNSNNKMKKLKCSYSFSMNLKNVRFVTMSDHYAIKIELRLKKKYIPKKNMKLVK